MFNTIKTLFMFLTLVFLVFLPRASYAWEDHHDRDGRSHHRHGFYSHVNPDLTLITGMDNIDSRVLIASDPDPTTEVIDQPAPENAVTIPARIISSDMDNDIIVNVPNKVGGYTPVRIQKSGNGYVGPQGELYYPFPEVSQLKAMYGI